MSWVEDQSSRLLRGTGQAVQQRRQRLNDLSRAMPRAESLLDTPRQRLDHVADRLPRALIAGVQNRHVALSRASAALRPATLRQMVETRRDRLRNLTSRLSLRPIGQEANRQRDRLAQLSQRLDAAQGLRVERQRQQLEARGRQLDILSYKATLARGYAVVRSGKKIVTNTVQAAEASSLSIEFSDGVADLDLLAAASDRTSGA